MSHRIAIQLCRENAVGASELSRWELDPECLDTETCTHVLNRMTT